MKFNFFYCYLIIHTICLGLVVFPRVRWFLVSEMDGFFFPTYIYHILQSGHDCFKNTKQKGVLFKKNANSPFHRKEAIKKKRDCEVLKVFINSQCH